MLGPIGPPIHQHLGGNHDAGTGVLVVVIVVVVQNVLRRLRRVFLSLFWPCPLTSSFSMS